MKKATVVDGGFVVVAAAAQWNISSGTWQCFISVRVVEPNRRSFQLLWPKAPITISAAPWL
ncbi:hypothetical protein D3C84_1287350 [compost metagenome]